MTGFALRCLACCTALILFGTILVYPVAASTITLHQTESGSSRTPTIANGDTVLIPGIATGHPRNGLQLWIISHNYLKVTSVAVNDDNTYLYELKSADTENLASGQYFVVVQHPMMNGQFDIIYDRASGKVINRQLGNGMEIFTIAGPGNLQGPDSAQALVEAISSQNIDDSFATYTFFISPPGAFIDPIGNHYVGDKFTISGSTNLAVGDELMIDVTSSSFKPTEKAQGSEFSGASGVVTIVPGNSGYNRWYFDIDATAFKPDEYIVKVAGITQDVTGSAYFNILPALPPASATTTATLTDTTAVPTTTRLPLTVTTTPKSPVACWVALGALALLTLVRKRN
jgi:trimeric autotransporter adhesin